MKGIDAVVNEVVRRLTLLTGSRKVLVASEGGKLMEEVRSRMRKSYPEDCVFTGCFNGEADNGKAGDPVFHSLTDMPEAGERMRELVAFHDSFLISGLSISQIAALDVLRVETRIQALIYEIMRQGKEACIFSEDLRLTAAGKKFREDVARRVLPLEKWGIVFPQLEDIPYSLADKQVISLEDIKKAESKVIAAGEHTVVTTGAGKYMEDHGILLIRKG